MADLDAFYAVAVIMFPGFRVVMMVYMFLFQQSVQERVESLWSRLGLLVLVCMIIAFSFLEGKDIDALRWSNLQKTTDWTDNIRITGSVIALLAGVGFVWVHIHLGYNWTGTVNLMEQHSLVTSGPYKLARHPMYTVFFMYSIGLFLITGYILTSLSVLALSLWAARRIALEEKLMIQEFGGEYVDFKRRVGAFLPCLWFDCGLSMENAEEIERTRNDSDYVRLAP
eukprot:GFYU01008127.1.p1 GENE.GFYU01008127.1~~GFYU01008127.1.p1  ORF type:complete len:226 (-),score=54.27 GFYU01008127.1:156-833(-)